MKGELIKGDENNLEGRVFVLSATTTPKISVGSFAESDVEIFRKVCGVLCENGRFSESDIEDLIKCHVVEEEAFKKFKADELDLPLDRLSIPSYSVRFALSSADPKQTVLAGERIISERNNIE